MGVERIPLPVIRTNLNVEMTICCSSWALLEPQSVLFHMCWYVEEEDLRLSSR